MAVDALQADVARIALTAAQEHGFALAGGNALVAHGVLERATEDVDLFTPEPGGPGAVIDTVRAALEEAGYAVEVTRPPEVHHGEFARLAVTRGDQGVAALVGRGLPRDFIDVAASLGRYSRPKLMRLAFIRDPGLRVEDFASAARRLDHLPADMFAVHGLDSAAVAELRGRFADWPRDPQVDTEGQAVHRGTGLVTDSEAAPNSEPQQGTKLPSARSSPGRGPGGVPGDPGSLPPAGLAPERPGFER